jgi:SpoVK/Ycf46/Vps4 family AAA+-type ATPase
MDYFPSSSAHLLAEIERIDLLVRAQVARIRAVQAEDEQFRGLYISEQDVDSLLQQPIGRPTWVSSEQGPPARVDVALSELSRRIEMLKRGSASHGVELRLEWLRRRYELDRFDVDALLVCLAVELDLRYERLYAYLQDDVTKKKPSIDLVLNLLSTSTESKLSARERFSADSPLVRHHLVELLEEASQPRPPLLAKYLKVDERIARYLFDSDALDESIRSYVRAVTPTTSLSDMVLDERIKHGLKALVSNPRGVDHLVIHLRGPYGIGKQSIAEALCREMHRNLIVVDLERLITDGEAVLGRLLPFICREAELQRAAIYWKGFDALLVESHRGALGALLGEIESRPRLAFLSGELPWQPTGVLQSIAFQSVTLPRPNSRERVEMWRVALSTGRPAEVTYDLAGLSNKFKLTYGQIQDAAATARHLAQWRDPKAAQITLADLYEACRVHSNQKLSVLARKIVPKYEWNDIVLQPDRVAQLRDICNHVKYHDRVYVEWGFDKKLSLGKGLAVLFAGPSGTGKTMAAEIIASELGLDLYKIDLSSMVSKYIGETEKNLARVFAEAETSNAILFFDEADALFGKRSEVKDSHDRYANIEIGYLLQRMEEYEGVVILATNFRKNMDEAFVRRLHFTVEFPFPNHSDRRRIWEGIWPADTPRDPQLELDFVARRFELTGGNIRNIALAAAFLAADDGGTVQMGHIVRATQREYQKIGKIMAEEELRERPRET